MKNSILFCIAICFLTVSYGQKSPAALKITYLKSSNGKLIENQDPVVVFANTERTIVTTLNILAKKAEYPIEQSYVDRKTGNYVQLARFANGKAAITIDSTSLQKQSFELLTETKMILGYKCAKAKTIINSNTIEIWYTNDLIHKGAPTSLGQNLGLVLEMTRNGNFTVLAQKVEKLKNIPAELS